MKAAQADTSVSALVRNFLAEIAQEETDWERRKRIEKEVLAGIRHFSAADRVSREELHDR